MLSIGFRVRGQQFGECIRLLDQAVAPILNLVQPRRVLARDAVPGIQLGQNGGGLHIAHQTADVLQLAVERAELGHAFVFQDGFQQIFGQIEFSQFLFGQSGQRFAQVLQFEHLLLDLGFAGWKFFFQFFVVSLARIHGVGKVQQMLL